MISKSWHFYIGDNSRKISDMGYSAQGEEELETGELNLPGGEDRDGSSHTNL